MQLNNLLSNESLVNYKIIAGEDGLTRMVQSINIMDAPDFTHFVKPGELLLSNGYFMKDSPELLGELIEYMNRMDCPGIAIKTKRFLLSIPQSVLDVANRLQFPIIEISDVKNSLGEILNQLTSVILENKSQDLQYALSIHKQFTSTIMNGEGVSQIIETLSHLLSVPVMIINHKMQVSESSSFLKQKNMQFVMDHIIAVLHTLPILHNRVSLCMIHPKLGKFRHIDLFPIHTSRHEGYIVCLPKVQSSSKVYELTFEEATNVIRMEILNKQAIMQRSRRYKNEYFSDLIDETITSEHVAFYRGQEYGLKSNGPFLLIAAKIEVNPNRDTGLHYDENLIVNREDQYELMEQYFSVVSDSPIIFTKNDLFGILIKLQDSNLDKSEFLLLLENITTDLYQNAQLCISLGIGNPVTKILDIGLSFREAARALLIGYQMKKKRFIQFYTSNDISYLLRLLPVEKLENFYEETFRSFEVLPDHEKKELLRTLKVFYDNQGQLVDSAKQLFIHRNTLVYRLEKCEKIIGIKLKDPMQSLRFRVAFAVEPFLEGNDSLIDANYPELVKNSSLF